MTLPPSPLPYDRAGTGQPLLLLHGALVDRAYWHHERDLLATRFDVIACDLPGHGEAPPPSQPPTIAAYAAAVIATLDALALPSVIILGHSLGGMVAQELALSAPSRVRALILADTWCRPRGYLGELFPFRTAYLHWALRTVPVAQMIDLMALGVARNNPTILPYARRVMSRYIHDRDTYLQIWDACTDFESGARLHQITCPTLIVNSDSYLFTNHQAVRLAAGIPGALLAIIPHSSHWVNWDNPTAFERAILTFLNQFAPIGVKATAST